GYHWSNQRRTLVSRGNIGVRRRQLFDTSSPLSFEEDKLYASWDVAYRPIHQRWYASLGVFYFKSLDADLGSDIADRLTFFTDEEPRGEVRVAYGRGLGPKWDTEIAVRWDDRVDGLRRVSWMLQRDLHDAIATLEVAVERDDDDFRVERRDKPDDTEVDVRFGLQVKLP